MSALDDVRERLRSMLSGLDRRQRLALAAVAGGGVIVALVVAVAGSDVAYRSVYPQLTPRDAREVSRVLGRHGVAFEIDARSGQVQVPAERVDEVRMLLASEGLPAQGGAGFELFDESQFGQTEFERKVTYQRALQGELERTILGLDVVEAARVHLVMPTREPFRKDRVPASASVVVRLRPGRQLSETQLFGIVHLVSSAVGDLDPDQVTVIDHEGRPLGSTREADSMLEHGREIEANLARRIEELIMPIVGVGRVVARVGVELERQQVETSEVRLDPDRSAVLSESRREESSNQAGAGGEGGVEANVPGGAVTATTGTGERRSAQEETLNYELTKVESRSVAPAGGVRRITAAVLVDGTYTAAEDGTSAYQPRTAEELERITALVQEAIGFSAERGDRVRVENLRFQLDEVMAEGPSQVSRWFVGPGLAVLRAVAWPLVALALIVLVVRPALPALVPAVAPPTPAAATVTETRPGETLSLLDEEPVEIAALELESGIDAQAEAQRLREEVAALARADPPRVAAVVRALLHDSHEAVE